MTVDPADSVTVTVNGVAQPAAAGSSLRALVDALGFAGRPIAVTADLAGFWRGGWAEVRRELRGRYPKHAWPERPWERAVET